MREGASRRTAVLALVVLLLAGSPVMASRAGQNCKNGKAANCYANLSVDGGLTLELQFDLRGGGAAWATAESLTTVQYEWFGNTLYQDHPELGRILVRLREDMSSTAELISGASSASPFFPAMAESRMFLELHLLDQGLVMLTHEPLVLRQQLSDFFETEHVMVLQNDVPIYLVDNPTSEVGMFLTGSEVRNFPPAGIEVERVGCAVDTTGIITLDWQVTSITGTTQEVFWSVDGSDGIDGLGQAWGLATLSSTPVPLHIQASMNHQEAESEIVLSVSGTTGDLTYGYNPVFITTVGCSDTQTAAVSLEAQ